MAGVELSDIPETPKDLEHYVAALFQASGYYVEKNVIDRAPADVLELDVVATDYFERAPRSRLVEAKSGNWGWTELFKMLGWMRYLDMSMGTLFVRTSSAKPLNVMKNKMSDYGLGVVCLDTFDAPFVDFTEAGFGTARSELVPLFRFSYEIERRLNQFVIDAAKAGALDSAKAALDYQRLVNDGTFLARNTFERLSMLYEAYREHPKLTLAAAVEMGGEPYEPRIAATKHPLLMRAFRRGESPFLQACMFNEHRARLALLKSAVDLTSELPGDHLPDALVGGEFDWDLFLLQTLPETFRKGQAWLANQPNFHLYAVFWQQFLWGWGGFYLQHRAEDEFAWMSEYSGIPVDEIPTALEAFDRFFPIPDGWFKTPGPTDMRIVAMVPWPFQGLGAHHRRCQYDTEKLEDLGGHGYTATDLGRRINETVRFLSA